MAQNFKISFSLEESDVAYFRKLFREARKAASEQDPARHHQGRRRLIARVRADQEDPELRGRGGHDPRRPGEDDPGSGLRAAKAPKAEVLGALAYFANPEDLIPDSIPGLGFLDDAIMIKILEEEFRHELWGFRQFRKFRERRGAAALDQRRARSPAASAPRAAPARSASRSSTGSASAILVVARAASPKFSQIPRTWRAMSDRARILIVDDEEAILETMAFTFEDDYDVLTAPSAPEALAVLDRSGPVAAVITDQRMPEMTGVEFLARVYERHPNTTRIILTGYADGDAMVRAINEGHVYAYVTKPWEPDELKQLVHRAVELHRLRMQNERLLDDVQQANRFLAAAIDEIPVGALVVDAAGIVRATNRSAREYLGLRADPRGQALAEVLGGDALREVRDTAARLGESDGARYEELELSLGGVSLRLRMAVRTIRQAEQPIGRVILLREISHEPLRRHFEDLLQEIKSEPGDLRVATREGAAGTRGCARRR